MIRSQKPLISSELRETTRYCPRLLVEICERMDIMINSKYSSAMAAMKSFLDVDDDIFPKKWGDEEDRILSNTKVADCIKSL